MASYQIKQSTTAYPLVFFMTDATDHISGKTGLTPTVTLAKAGGTFASPAGAVTEMANGWYKVAGNATDVNTLGSLILHATGTGADATDILYEVVAHDVQDTVRLGLTAFPAVASGSAGALIVAGTGTAALNVSGGRGDANVTFFGGSAGTFAAGRPEVNVSHFGGTAGTFAVGRPEVNTTHIAGAAVSTSTAQIGVNVVNFGGLAGTFASGRPETNTTHIVGAAVNTSTAQVGVNVVNFGGLAGTFAGGRPEVNTSHFGGTTGTFAAGRPEVNTTHIAGAAVNTSLAQLGVNVVNAGGTAWASGAITSGVFAAGAINAAAIATDAIGASELAADAVAEIAAAISTVRPIRSGTCQAGSGASSIKLDASASATDDVYNDTVVNLTGGTGVGQTRVITDYTGATQICAIVPAWTVTPDATTTFQIVPQWYQADGSGRAIASVQNMGTNVVTANSLATDAVQEIRDAILPPKNIALSNIEFLMVDSADHATPKTGLTISGTRSIDGGAFSAVSGAIAEVGNGIYQFDALAADMNGTIITFRFTGAGADARYLTVRTGG